MRTMGFRRRATLHLDLAASPNSSRPDASPKATQEEKNAGNDGVFAEKSGLREEEAAVELTIERLPEN